MEHALIFWMVLIIKILVTLFVIILIPNYWKNNGPENFLWLSDVGLFMTVLGLWLESPLIISMAVVGILVSEILWNLDYFLQLFTGRNYLGISFYMFDDKEKLLVRRLSLFHVVMPIIWIICLAKWGYDQRAFLYQTILTLIIFTLTYFLSDPNKNINWVFMPRVYHWKIPVWLWLISGSIAYVILIMLPTHLILKKIFI